MTEKIPTTGVKGLLFDPIEKKVLLVKRQETLLHGKYDLPGGAKDSDDLTPLAAIMRELKEELGLAEEVTISFYDVDYPDLEAALPDNPELHRLDLTLFFYLVEGVTANSLLTLLSTEVGDPIWADLETVIAMTETGELLPIVDAQILNLLLSHRE